MFSEEGRPYFAHPFLRALLKGNSCFSCGATPVQTPPQNPTSTSSVSYTQKTSPEVPERGGFGKIACGWAGWTGEKKGKWDAERKVGLSLCH